MTHPDFHIIYYERDSIVQGRMKANYWYQVEWHEKTPTRLFGLLGGEVVKKFASESHRMSALGPPLISPLRFTTVANAQAWIDRYKEVGGDPLKLRMTEVNR